jgi:hypothetical protein
MVILSYYTLRIFCYFILSYCWIFHYEKIMSIATNLFSCNLILLDIFSCIEQIVTKQFLHNVIG